MPSLGTWQHPAGRRAIFLGDLVDRARVIVPKQVDYLMHRMSIGFPGEVGVSAVKNFDDLPAA